MTLRGIDISDNQPGIDLQTVAEKGAVDFVVARTSEGTFEDQSWAGLRVQAEAAGLLFAGYHKMSGDSSPMKQARAIRNVVGDSEVPVIIDLESGNFSRQPTLLDAEHVWAAADGYGVVMSTLLYLPGWYWDALGRPNTANWALWESDYGPNDGKYPGDASDAWIGAGGRRAEVLQFTDKGRFPGYAGPLDVDAYRGTRTELAQTGWFKDYQEEDVTPEEIQTAVKSTPIVVDGQGTTQTLQQVLRRILNRKDPDPKVLAQAVSDLLSTSQGITKSDIEQALADVLTKGTDNA